jgi:DNA-binding response OmpR family regulator
MLLEDDGHSVTQLDGGKEVMDVIENFGVDVILLDLSMPDVDGFRVLDRLRRDRKAASIPVIVVSARGRPDDKALAKGFGAVDYINKPWDDGEVELRVQMALGGAQRRWAGQPIER